MRSKLTVMALTLWIAVFAYSFYSTVGIEPTGDGFTRGMNRLAVFFAWHFAAFAIAIGAMIAGWRETQPWRRWLSRGPAIIHLILIIGVVGVTFYQFQQAEQQAENDPAYQRQTTKSAAGAQPVQ